MIQERKKEGGSRDKGGKQDEGGRRKEEAGGRKGEAGRRTRNNIMYDRGRRTDDGEDFRRRR